MTDTLESALRERQKLTRAYRASKKAQFERAFAEEPRLRQFANAIKHCGPDDAKAMIAIVEVDMNIWLREATPETRALALEIVSLRIQQIRTRAGLVPIDDALPWEADDVWAICKRILA